MQLFDKPVFDAIWEMYNSQDPNARREPRTWLELGQSKFVGELTTAAWRMLGVIHDFQAHVKTKLRECADDEERSDLLHDAANISQSLLSTFLTQVDEDLKSAGVPPEIRDSICLRKGGIIAHCPCPAKARFGGGKSVLVLGSIIAIDNLESVH